MERAFLFVVSLYRSVVLSYFLASDGLDLHFLTYISYTAVSAFFVLLLALSRDKERLAAVLLFLLPPVFSLVFFIGIAIIVIVQLNDWVFTRTTVIFGGTRSVGEVHTGDFLLHQLPVVEIAFVLLFYANFLRDAYARFAKHTSKHGRRIYTTYVLLIGPFLVLLYCSTMDFKKNYPVHSLSVFVIITIAVLTSLATGFLFYSTLLLNKSMRETLPTIGSAFSWLSF